MAGREPRAPPRRPEVPWHAPNTAVLADVGIGDGLLSLVIAQNLRRAGHRVTVFNDVLHALEAWLPGFEIAPRIRSDKAAALERFDTVIDNYHGFLDDVPRLRPRVVRVDRSRFDRRVDQVANLTRFCEGTLGCTRPTRQPGLVAPAELCHRRHPRRVVIHPLSAREKKNWPPQAFLRVARRLCARGYQPVFSLGPGERERWGPVFAEGFELPRFDGLDALARYLFESGYLIGNDSGPGHLASALGVPTLILFYKRSKALRWAPAWGAGAVVTPALRIPGLSRGSGAWRHLLRPGRVARAFLRLAERSG